MVDKKGLIKLFLMIIGFLALVVVIGGIYFYNYYSFYSVATCISNVNVTDLKVACNSTSYCQDLMSKLYGQIKTNEVPDFMKSKTEEIMNTAITCQTTCKIKMIYRAEKSCRSDETEIDINIRGKELWQAYNYAKANNLSLTQMTKILG